MKTTWSAFFLRDLLYKSNSIIEIDSLTDYKEVTVRLWGKGVTLRGIKSGKDISSTKRTKVSAGQFIFSKIDARNGAFGLIPDELNGAVVTNDFPIFNIEKQQILPGYLNWLSKTAPFVEICRSSSKGTTNRVRLKEDFFLGIKLSLPPIADQQLIVAKIESLYEQILQVKRLRQEILDDAQAMLSSAFHQIIEGVEYQPMEKVAPIVRRKVDIDIDGMYPELGARSFGKGIFHKPTLIGSELDWQKLYTINAGDLVLSNIKAWEGAIAVANKDDHGRVASHRYITCVPKKNVITANFLCFYLLTKEGIEKVQAASPGSADRNRTLAMKRLEQITVPTPDYDKQLWFNSLQAKVADIKKAQADNQTELDALLPAILDKAFKGELI